MCNNNSTKHQTVLKFIITLRTDERPNKLTNMKTEDVFSIIFYSFSFFFVFLVKPPFHLYFSRWKRLFMPGFCYFGWLLLLFHCENYFSMWFLLLSPPFQLLCRDASRPLRPASPGQSPPEVLSTSDRWKSPRRPQRGPPPRPAGPGSTSLTATVLQFQGPNRTRGTSWGSTQPPWQPSPWQRWFSLRRCLFTVMALGMRPKLWLGASPAPIDFTPL